MNANQKCGWGMALVLGIFLAVGCQTGRLEPGGAYAPVDVAGNAILKPDYKYFVCDAAFKLAYGAIDAAFLFEKENRLYLWQLSPKVKQTLDRVRPAAVKARDDYARARAAYLANPVAANLSQMETILAELQRLLATAQAALPAGQKTGN